MRKSEKTTSLLQISRPEVPGRSARNRSCSPEPKSPNARSTANSVDWIDYIPARPSAAPFCTADTARAWLRSHPEARPLICHLRKNGKIVALLPLYRSGLSKTLRPTADTDLDYQDILADSDEDSIQLIVQLTEFCKSTNSQLSFGKVAENSRLHTALQSHRVKEKAWIISRYYSTCPVTKFSGLDEKEFRATLSKNKKEAFRKAGKRIREAFPEAAAEHLHASEITENHIAEIAEVHRTNQHRKSGKSIFCQAEFSEFLRQQTNAHSSLKLSILREGPAGKIMAFTLGYFDNDSYYYYIPSYEGKYHHLSPGVWLLTDCLRHFSTEIEGDTLYFDMLSGTESYKKRWASDSYKIVRTQLIPKKLTNIPRLLAYLAIYKLKAWKNRIRKIG